MLIFFLSLSLASVPVAATLQPRGLPEGWVVKGYSQPRGSLKRLEQNTTDQLLGRSLTGSLSDFSLEPRQRTCSDPYYPYSCDGYNTCCPYANIPKCCNNGACLDESLYECCDTETYGVCPYTGTCCGNGCFEGANDQCCSDGNACPSGEDCCIGRLESSCIDPADNCCGDGRYCPAGDECYLDPNGSPYDVCVGPNTVSFTLSSYTIPASTISFVLPSITFSSISAELPTTTSDTPSTAPTTAVSTVISVITSLPSSSIAVSSSSTTPLTSNDVLNTAASSSQTTSFRSNTVQGSPSAAAGDGTNGAASLHARSGFAKLGLAAYMGAFVFVGLGGMAM